MLLALVLLAPVLLSGCAQLEALTKTAGPGKDLAATRTETEAAAEAAADADEASGPIPEPQEAPKPGQLYEWKGDGRNITRIVIDTNLQRARFYAGNEQVGWTTVATGLPNHATPTGEFVILEKVKNKRSNLYGKIVNSKGAVIKHGADSRDRVPPGGRFVGASMPNFMRMTYDGVGMHAGPIPRPGRPASHGCIRMPKTMASAVYRHVSPGTPVTVVGTGPNYGNYAARVRQRRLEEQARRAAAEAARQGTALDALDAEIETMRQADQADETAQPGAGGTANTDAAAADTPAGAESSQPSAAEEPAPDTAPEPPPARAEGPADEGGGEPPPENGPPGDAGDEPHRYHPPAPPPEIRSAGVPASTASTG